MQAPYLGSNLANSIVRKSEPTPNLTFSSHLELSLNRPLCTWANSFKSTGTIKVVCTELWSQKVDRYVMTQQQNKIQKTLQAHPIPYKNIFLSNHKLHFKLFLHCTPSDCSDFFNLQRYNFFHSLIESFLIGQD